MAHYLVVAGLNLSPDKGSPELIVVGWCSLATAGEPDAGQDDDDGALHGQAAVQPDQGSHQRDEIDFGPDSTEIGI